MRDGAYQRGWGDSIPWVTGRRARAHPETVAIPSHSHTTRPNPELLRADPAAVI